MNPPIVSIQGLRLSGLSVAVPTRIVHNKDLLWMNEGERKALMTHLGIETRRVATKGRLTELATQAARGLQQNLGYNNEKIDLLLLVTQTGDDRIPGTVYALHDALGLHSGCVCIEANWACAGYVYALWSAGAWLNQMKGQHALMIVGDCSTRCLNHQDASTVPIFSDAVSATWLSRDNTATTPWRFQLGSHSAHRHSIYQSAQSQNGLHMDGLKVLAFVLGVVRQSLEAFLADTNEPIDYYLFHQASALINDSLRRRLKIAQARCPSSLRQWGNTSSASIPLTMITCLGDALKKQPQRLLLSGFGAGLAWGNAHIETHRPNILPIIECNA